jgi:hypothetical protein
MLPYIAFALAVIFVFLKVSGAWDEFTSAMGNLQKFQGKRNASRRDANEDEANRLEIFREFLEGPEEDDLDDSSGD